LHRSGSLHRNVEAIGTERLQQVIHSG
jgi:hypothetical protein